MPGKRYFNRSLPKHSITKYTRTKHYSVTACTEPVSVEVTGKYISTFCMHFSNKWNILLELTGCCTFHCSQLYSMYVLPYKQIVRYMSHSVQTFKRLFTKILSAMCNKLFYSEVNFL